MSNEQSSDKRSSNGRSSSIESVMMDVLQRRLAGEQLSDKEVVAQHPELMPYLVEELRLADELQSSAESTDRDTAADHRDPGVLTVRCPHCCEPVKLPPDVSFTDILCGSCHSRFSLATDASEFDSGSKLDVLGHFQLIERLGVGSFGTVWKARDHELDRLVAVKVPRQGSFERGGIEKFLREARTAAQLNHPNVVTVHEVGRIDDTVFIVNDFINGRPLSEWRIQRQPSFREVAKICVKIADALHHAHVHSVTHRDLKPQNILVDADAEPHLMDFGLARRDAGETTITMDGHVIGTPAYMSPEQARGESHKADCRSDVYSFGVILFELLTGELPFRGDTSVLIHQLLYEEVSSPRKLNRSIPRDLETICLKCLEKQPAKRYDSALEVASELRRFLAAEPIRARPPSVRARTWSWCRRKPLAATLLLVLLVVALTGPMVAFTQVRLRLEADRATGAANEARSWAKDAQTKAEQRASELSAAYQQLNDSYRAMYLEQIHVASSALERGDMASFHDRLELCAEELRGWEWRYLDLSGRLVAEQGKILAGTTSPVRALAFSPDGERFALGSVDGTIRVLRTAELKEERRIQGHQGQIQALDFSADGKYLLAGDSDGILKVWNWKAAKEGVVLKGHGAAVQFARFSSDGRHVISGGGGLLRSWDLEEKAPVRREIPQHAGIIPRVISRDLKFGFGGVGGSSAWIFDIKTGNQVAAFPGDFILRFTNDNRAAIVGGPDGFIRAHQLCAMPGARTLIGRHDNPISSIAVSAHSSRAATGDRNGIIKIWDLKSDQELMTFFGHRSPIEDLVLSPDGTMVVSRDANETVCLWRTHARRSIVKVVDAGLAKPYAISPDGRWCAAGMLEPTRFQDGQATAIDGHQSTLRVWDLTTGVPRAVLHNDGLRPTCLAFSPDGDILAVGTGDERTLILWDTHTWRQIQRRTFSMSVRSLCFSSSGDSLAIGGEAHRERTGIVTIWQRSTDATREIPIQNSGVTELAYSSDEQRVAAVSDDGAAMVLDANSGQQLALLTDSGVRQLAFSPDLNWIVGGGEEGLRIWDGQSYQQIQIIPTPSVMSLDVSADGRRIVAGFADGMVRVWESTSGKLALGLPFGVPNLTVGDVTFSRRDERLIACALLVDKMCVTMWLGTSKTGEFPECLVDLIQRRMQEINPDDGWQYPAQLASAYIQRLREIEPVANGSEARRLAGLFEQLHESSAARDSSTRRQWNALERIMLQQQTWLVAGPLPSGPNHDGLTDELAPELLGPMIDLTATFEGVDGRVSWQTVRVNAWDVCSQTTCSGRYYVDLLSLFPRSESVLALLAGYCDSPREQEVELRLGSDDGVKVWLNDVAIHTNPDYGPYREAEDRLTVTLREGRNKILVKVDQSGGAWGFALEFVDKHGWPADIRWVTDLDQMRDRP